MPKETKANRAQSEARLNKVYDLLVIGLSRWQVWQYVTGDKGKELFQDISRRQLDRYIAQASEMLATEAAYHRPREFGRAIAALNTLYAASLKVQDYKAALAVRREINALLALYEAPAKQTIAIEGLDLFSLLSSKAAAAGLDVEALLSALLEEIGGDKP